MEGGEPESDEDEEQKVSSNNQSVPKILFGHAPTIKNNEIEEDDISRANSCTPLEQQNQINFEGEFGRAVSA